MKNKLFPILTFFFGFCFWFFLLEKLPFTFGDDLNVLQFAQESNWAELFKAFLNPLTPAFYVHGMESLSNTRALEPIVFKFLYNISGYSPTIFELVKVLSIAISGTFLFLIIQKSDDKNSLNLPRFIIFLGAVLFLTSAPLYRGISWIADLDILAQLGTIGASYFFLSLYLSPKNEFYYLPKKIIKFNWSQLILMVVFYWIGMKTKETGRIFPLIALLFILVDQNKNIFSWLRTSKSNFLLGVTLALLLFTIIPMGGSEATVLDSRSAEVTSSFNLNNVITVLWSNPASDHIPSDLATTFYWGLFFLIPLLVLFLIIHLFKGTISKSNIRLLLYSFIWSGAAVASTCLGVHLEENERYLSIVLIPAVLFSFLTISITSKLISTRLRKYFLLIVIVLTAIPIQRNIDHIVFIKKLYDNRNIADWKGTQVIFEDKYNETPSWENLHSFYRGKTPYSRELFHKARIKEWDTSISSSINTMNKLAKEYGQAYAISFKPNWHQGESTIKRIASLDTTTGSLYTTLMPKIKKKSLQQFYVYKATPKKDVSPQSSDIS